MARSFSFSFNKFRIVKFLSILFLLFLLYLVTFYQLGQIEKQKILEKQEVLIIQNLEYTYKLINTNIESIISDIRFLSRCNEMERFLETDEGKSELAFEFKRFSESRLLYDQIRLLNTEGQELIRVDTKNEGCSIVPENDLQNKKDRYYFRASLKLPQGSIYISPMDLNIENEVIELPEKPVMRFSIPLFDQSGNRKEILVLNYLGSHILSLIEDIERNSLGKISFLNERGYWLYNSSKPEYNWAFMYPEKTDIRISNLLPEQWELFSKHDKVQEVIDETILTSVLFYPGLSKASVSLEKWYLLNISSFNDLGISRKQMNKKFYYLSIFVIPLILVLSFLIAFFWHSAAERKKELKRNALFDALTGLPNRNILFEKITALLKYSKRYKTIYCLIFVDLDGFKGVNDTYGHEAGDELLRQVASRLLGCVRNSDLVSRIGGDEFVILISKVTSRNDCDIIAAKILNELSREFNLEKCTVSISASIGLALGGNSETEETTEILMNRADRAMYKAKKSGKNRYAFD